MRLTLTIALSFYFIINAYSQGCSDAGMCTINGLDAGNHNKGDSKNSIQVSTIFGLGEQNVFHSDIELNAQYQTFKNQYVQIKIPYRMTFGNLGNVTGLGDMIVSVKQSVFNWETGELIIVAGIKIPSNDANKNLNGNPLPMAYQTSLGTYDLILGTGITLKKWYISAGYQHSFGNNLNEFQHLDSNPKYFNNYQESYHLKRADDIMLRIERHWELKKSTITFGALPIYHLSNDVIKENETVQNSNGLTFNLNSRIDIPVIENHNLSFLLAAPIIDKENRPDGLTRSFVAVATLTRRF